MWVKSAADGSVGLQGRVDEDLAGLSLKSRMLPAFVLNEVAGFSLGGMLRGWRIRFEKWGVAGFAFRPAETCSIALLDYWTRPDFAFAFRDGHQTVRRVRGRRKGRLLSIAGRTFRESARAKGA
jgi:hypothetical protein